MFYLADTRTGFYHVRNHEGFIAETKEEFPPSETDNPYIRAEYYEEEEEPDLISDMFNHGIFRLRVGRKRSVIELDDLLYLDPCYMEYYLSLLKNGQRQYQKLLWGERAYFIVDLSGVPKFLTTKIKGKIYYCAFASKMDASDYFKQNEEKFEGFQIEQYPLENNLNFCLYGCNTCLLLEAEDNKKTKEGEEESKKTDRRIRKDKKEND